jgi:hypothetical protein
MPLSAGRFRPPLAQTDDAETPVVDQIRVRVLMLDERRGFYGGLAGEGDPPPVETGEPHEDSDGFEPSAWS